MKQKNEDKINNIADNMVDDFFPDDMCLLEGIAKLHCYFCTVFRDTSNIEIKGKEAINGNNVNRCRFKNSKSSIDEIINLL